MSIKEKVSSTMYQKTERYTKEDPWTNMNILWTPVFYEYIFELQWIDTLECRHCHRRANQWIKYCTSCWELGAWYSKDSRFRQIYCTFHDMDKKWKTMKMTPIAITIYYALKLRHAQPIYLRHMRIAKCVLMSLAWTWDRIPMGMHFYHAKVWY